MNERSFIVNPYSPSLMRFSDYDLAWFFRLFFGETTFLGSPALPAWSRQPVLSSSVLAPRLRPCIQIHLHRVLRHGRQVDLNTRSDPLAPRVATWPAQLAL